MSDEKAQKAFGESLLSEMRAVQQLEAGKPPSMIPPSGPVDSSKADDQEANRWKALRPALFAAFASRVMNMGTTEDSALVMPLLGCGGCCPK